MSVMDNGISSRDAGGGGGGGGNDLLSGYLCKIGSRLPIPLLQNRAVIMLLPHFNTTID